VKPQVIINPPDRILSMTQPHTSDLWKIRVYFALFFGAGGILYPFISLYYEQVGLTGAQMGLLTSLGWTISLLFAPLWGRWGDTARRPRLVLQIALVGSGMSNLFLGLQSTFLTIAIFIAIGSFFDNSLDSLSTTHTLAITDGTKSGFGSVRLFGSIGWAIAAPLAGWLIERTGMLVPFAGYALATILGAVLLTFIATTRNTNLPQSEATRPPLGKVLANLARDRSMLGLALALFIIWLTGTGRAQFEAIYLTQLGASVGVVGVANAIGAIIEPPFMLLSDQYVRRFGAGAVLRLAMLVQAAGMAAVVAIPSVASIIVFRAVQGISFSLTTVSLVSYIVEGAPEGQSTTTMSLYYVTLHGLVIMMAAPINGIFFDLLGAYWLYAIGLGGALLGWLILRLTARQAQGPGRRAVPSL